MVNSNFRRIIRTIRLSLSRERHRFLYGYYNSEQPLIRVKICTAVDKEKWDYGNAGMKQQVCNEKLKNTEIAVFLC